MATRPTVVTTSSGGKESEKKSVATRNGNGDDKLLSGDKVASDFQIIRHMMRYVWPKDDVGVKIRVITALALLAGGKVGHAKRRSLKSTNHLYRTIL
jgi:ATP-binding cassette subfamily B (MDR/TAP) protein 7